MTKELANKLIQWYEDTIELIEKKPEKAYSICLQRKTEEGVCFCSLKIFNTDIITDNWAKSKRSLNSEYWCVIPQPIDTPQEIIDVLQIRIDILKTFE